MDNPELVFSDADLNVEDNDGSDVEGGVDEEDWDDGSSSDEDYIPSFAIRYVTMYYIIYHTIHQSILFDNFSNMTKPSDYVCFKYTGRVVL